jgi:methionyl-tRNA synthetase
MEQITYNDFAKLEIKIGTIEAIEIVPDTDKLLRLTVNVGEETPRQIISGIREFFADPKELVGRQCPFLTNLEPRVIRGLESQGMILAASAEEQFSLLTVSNPLPPGTRVR